MQHIPLVSVVLPARNAALTLPAALESLRVQTLRNFEVIAIDDGSQDATAAVLATHAAQDDRFRFVSAKGHGLVAALNQGLRLARGAFIARMDADDLAAPQRLQAQLDWLARHPDVDLVSCLVEVVGHGEAPPGAGMVRYVDWLNRVQTAADIAAARFIESPVAHPTVLFRKTLLTKHGAYREGPFPEDYDLWLRLLGAGVHFAKVPEVLLTWRDHPTRASRTDPRYHRDAFRQLKIAHLLEGPLAARPPVVFMGAGLEGKPFLRAFAHEGLHVPYVFDLDPRKQGQRIHGARVVPPERLHGVLAEHPEALVLAAVGVPGAREVIRAMLAPTACVEGKTSFFLC